jgi:SPX domain protein involved in polyphosphate accumulation
VEGEVAGWAVPDLMVGNRVEVLVDQPLFHRINYDHLIVKLSKLFDLVRTRGHPVEGDSTPGGSQSAFVRSTTKYLGP